MALDDTVQRGDLGVVGSVWDCEAGERYVHFANWEGTMPERQLNMCNFQKGTLVHLSKEGLHSAVGEVVLWDEGKLVVDVLGEKVKVPPTHLIRCDFQKHSTVHVLSKTEASDKVYQIGEGLYSLAGGLRDGKLILNTNDGYDFFDPEQLALAKIQRGDYVIAPNGQTGWARGIDADRLHFSVQFKGFAEASFAPSELRRSPLQKDTLVTWTLHYEDVPKGTVASADLSNVRVYAKENLNHGTWNFRVSQLRPLRFQPGDYVQWKKHDEDIPEGDIGEVVRLKENGKIYIQWPKCLCSFWPSSLKLLPFQRRDLVHWASADDDIPTGSIGRVRGIKYSDGGSRLYVNFPKGAWAFSPGCLDAEPNVSGWCHSSNSDLTSANWTTAGIHRLKASFARFDQNGDGNITPAELAERLEIFCWPCPVGEYYLDENGSLSVEEFVDYVFQDADREITDGFREHVGLEKPGT
ncbi:unnamed protein product, partial [Cladocopium goreaui]